MTIVQEEKITRRKLSLLQLAQELGNVSRACKIVGYSRQQFYEVRRNFQLYGAEGLIDQLPGLRGPHPNRVGEEVEAAILEHSLACPTQGAQRVADELLLRGVQVSSGGVRGVTADMPGIDVRISDRRLRVSSARSSFWISASMRFSWCSICFEALLVEPPGKGVAQVLAAVGDGGPVPDQRITDELELGQIALGCGLR